MSKTEGRRFAFTLAAAFALVAAVMWWRAHETLMYGAGAASLALAVAGVVVPGMLGPVFRAWMRLGHALSRVMTPLVMGILYLFLFTPIGLLMRVFGRNPLVHKTANDSYWTERPPPRGKAALERQF
ncbi:MAG TPA: SxtJ family membrane protein [Longimicrobiales bacterium]